MKECYVRSFARFLRRKLYLPMVAMLAAMKELRTFGWSRSWRHFLGVLSETRAGQACRVGCMEQGLQIVFPQLLRYLPQEYIATVWQKLGHIVVGLELVELEQADCDCLPQRC